MDASGDSSDLVGNLRRQHPEEENYDVKAKKLKFDVTVAEISNELQSSSESSSEVNNQAEEIDEDILKYEELVSQLDILLSELLKESSEENKECVQKWNDRFIELKNEVCDSNVVIGVIGKTRHGKSSLINALLEPCEVLPVSDMQSCTAVVVQIEKNKKGGEFEAEIEFLEKEEWELELSILKKDYDNGKEDRFIPESVAGMAYSKLKGIYGEFESLEDLPNEVAILSSLGKTKTVTSDSSSDLQIKIEKYIRAFSKAGNQYWPIVKKVTVRIPGNDIIVDGCMLVDLPGYGDDNAARVKVAEDFLKNCSKILVVSDITEALSNKFIKLDGGFGDQVLKDMMETHLVFICTMNDRPVKPDAFVRELTMEKEEHAANQLQQKIEELNGSLSSSSLSTKEKDRKNKLLRERRYLGINARASFVKKKIKTNYEEFCIKWKRRDTCTSIANNEPAVFCVSSEEYLNIKQDGLCETFSDENETEIPGLKNHIKDLVMNTRRTTKQRKIKNLDDFVADIVFYFQDGNLQNKSGEIKACVKEGVFGLMEDMEAIAGTIKQDIIKQMSDIISNLEDGRERSELEAIRTCEKWSKLHRKTYFAVMRRGGIFKSGASGEINFNADLIEPFTSSMNVVWSDFFSKRLWELIKERNESVLQTLKKSVDCLCDKLEKKKISKARLFDIQNHLLHSANNMLKNMETYLRYMVLIEQREISRLCIPIVKERMMSTYKNLPEKETEWEFINIKNTMKTYVSQIKGEMFKDVHEAVKKKLENLLLTKVIRQIDKVWKTSLLDCFFSFGQLSPSGLNVSEKKLSNDIKTIIKVQTTQLCAKLNMNTSVSSRIYSSMPINCIEDKEIVEDSEKPFNFEKTIDTTELARDCRLLACATRSVGIIHGLRSHGTGFRIGSCFLATARHVIASNALKEGTDNSEIDHDMVTSDELFVEFEYMAPKNNYRGDRYTFSKVCYESKHLDFIILEIKQKDRPLPPCLKISEIVTKKPAYLLGHPNQDPQKLDKIQYYELDKDFLKTSKECALKYGYKTDYYSGIDKKGTTLIHTSFKCGASGAPVIMTDVNSEEPAAVLMLVCGFPEFYYVDMPRFTEEDKKNFLIVEQCVQLYSLLQDLKKQPEYQALAKDIGEA